MVSFRLQHVIEYSGLQILRYISQVNASCEELIAAATNMDEVTVRNAWTSWFAQLRFLAVRMSGTAGQLDTTFA